MNSRIISATQDLAREHAIVATGEGFSATLAVCRRERVFSEESALGGRFEVKIRATDAILPSHSTINEVGKLLSDRLLAARSVTTFVATML